MSSEVLNSMHDSSSPTTSTQKNVPSLRFAEFGSDWQNKTIDDILIRQNNPVTVEPNTLYREIGVRSHGKGIFHKEPKLGTSLGNKRVFWVIENAFVVNIVFGWEQAVAMTSNNEKGFIASHRFPMFLPKNKAVDIDFLLSFFLRKRGKYLLGLASPGGAGRNKTLGQGEFLKLQVTIPSLPEQQKITSILSSVDSKINLLKEKHSQLQQYKKGVMQQIFSQKLRFTQADGSAYPDWEEKKLGDIAKRITLKNTDDAISRVLTNSATQGVLDQQAYFDKDIANANNLEGYYVVDIGDYVYNPRISVSAPVGPINKNNVGKGVMSPLYTVFRFNEANNTFFELYFQSSFWHKYMCTVANYGARHDRMNITSADFIDMPLPFPCIEEQQKITECLMAIDAKIDAVADQLASVQAFKKGLLQKMFV